MIGERLAAARESRGWSVRELQRRSRVAQATIIKIESDESSPTLRILERLAKGLGISVAELIGSEPIADPLRAKFDAWLDTCTEEKRRWLYETARMAGFPSRMTLASS